MFRSLLRFERGPSSPDRKNRVLLIFVVPPMDVPGSSPKRKNSAFGVQSNEVLLPSLFISLLYNVLSAEFSSGYFANEIRNG